MYNVIGLEVHHFHLSDSSAPLLKVLEHITIFKKEEYSKIRMISSYFNLFYFIFYFIFTMFVVCTEYILSPGGGPGFFNRQFYTFRCVIEVQKFI